MSDSSLYQYVLLDSKFHNRAAFSCGEPSLDSYLQQRASQDIKRHASVVYVMTSIEAPEKIIGYYTLSSAAVYLDAIPAEAAKKFPRYPEVSATLLGRLAIDNEHKGMGHGARLLRQALKMSLKQSEMIASAMVVVDALNESAKQFYERYDFQPLTDNPMRLYLPMTVLAKAMNS